MPEKNVSQPAPEKSGQPDSSGRTLSEVLAAYKIELPAKQVDQLDRYCRALWEWNTKLNLTRHTDYEKFVTRDLVDTLQLAAHLQEGEHILDVGTGGGVPGVPLAILRPDLDVELCDATGKKAKAVGAILDEIELDLNVWHAKAEELLKAHRFHTLTVRALSRLDRILEIFAPAWYAFDRLLLIKGPAWIEERGEARHFGRLTNLALRKLADYTNPGMEHQSVILQICQKKRLAEIEKRAENLAAGIPIEETAEIVAVQTESGFPARQAGGVKPFRPPRGKRPFGTYAKGGKFGNLGKTNAGRRRGTAEEDGRGKKGGPKRSSKGKPAGGPRRGGPGLNRQPRSPH